MVATAGPVRAGRARLARRHRWTPSSLRIAGTRRRYRVSSNNVEAACGTLLGSAEVLRLIAALALVAVSMAAYGGVAVRNVTPEVGATYA